MEPSALDRTVHTVAHPNVGNAIHRALHGAPRLVARSAATLVAAACLSAALSAAQAAPPAAGSTEDNGLAEIVVTAEKVRSTVLDTPISLTAVSAAQLTAAGITSVEQIAHDVPGLSMRSAGPGLTEYEARGLASNGGAAPTVGFYLDEIPLSPPALSQSGKVVIDPSLYDLERVEVLRGPQGTLYGSSSMGGTVKVVTAQPKLNLFEGSVQATVSDTTGGGGNWSGNAMLNLPIGDMLAVRIVGGDLYRSGWIDQVNLGTAGFPVTLGVPTFGNLGAVTPVSVIKNANDERLWGGRATVLFKPSDDLSITAMVFNQKMALGGYDLLDSQPTSPQPGPIYKAHYSAFPFREGVHDDITIYGLTVNANVGFADLTSATSYFDRLGWQTQDASESIYWTNGGGTPFVPVPYSERDPSRQFTQELRLTSRNDGALHWVAGAFYSRLNSTWEEISNNAALTPGYQPPPAAQPTAQQVFETGSFFTSWNPYSVSQVALFADGSYKITDHWKVAAGLRWYKYSSRQDEISWGFDGPNPDKTTAFANATTTRAGDRGPRLPAGRRQPDPAAADVAAVLRARGPAVVRAGQRLELRGRREGAAVRQLADRQQRLLLHQVARRAAGVHAALRLPVLQQRGRRARLRPGARGQREARRGMDGVAERRLHGLEDHEPERGLPEVPDDAGGRVAGPVDEHLLPDRGRLHGADPERREGHGEHLARLFDGRRVGLQADRAALRQLHGHVDGRCLLLRLPAPVLQHRQRPADARAQRLVGAPVRRQPDEQAGADQLQQHELPVQHPAARALLDQPAAHRRRAAELPLLSLPPPAPRGAGGFPGRPAVH